MYTVSLYPLSVLQIDLSRKIQELDSCYNMKLNSLQVDRKYPITFAERIPTRFGPAIVLAIRDTPDRILKVFMPRRFFSAFSNDDKIVAAPVQKTEINGRGDPLR